MTADIVDICFENHFQANGLANRLIEIDKENAAHYQSFKSGFKAGWNACNDLGLNGIPWLPIDTAPKDGTLVDLWLGNDEFQRRVTDCSFRELSDEEYWVADRQLKGKYWFDCHAIRYLPTHWRPILDGPRR